MDKARLPWSIGHWPGEIFGSMPPAFHPKHPVPPGSRAGPHRISPNAFLCRTQYLQWTCWPGPAFSKSILQDYFSQVEEKLPEMHNLIQSGNLVEAGKLAHFLKGSSAGVGAANVRNICDDMQHYSLHSTDHKSYLESKLKELETEYLIVKQAFSDLLYLK